MPTINGTIHAGICGFETKVTASSDGDTVHLGIDSQCEKIRGLAVRLEPVDPIMEITQGWDGSILSAARVALRGCCSGCLVPAGIFKTVQVAGGLALPQEASVTIRREDT